MLLGFSLYCQILSNIVEYQPIFAKMYVRNIWILSNIVRLLNIVKELTNVVLYKPILSLGGLCGHFLMTAKTDLYAVENQNWHN